MPRTPDDFPGQRIEDSILFLSGSDYPIENGEVRYVSGSGFKFMEEGVVKTLSSSSGISDVSHQTLNQLIHLAEQGGPWQGYGNPIQDAGPWPFPTASVWWTDSTRTKKIVQKVITRNENQAPATIQWQSFQTDGTTVAESITDHILYSGAFEVSRSRSSP